MCDDGPYEAFTDPYCYEGTTVLKNIPDLQDQLALDRFETAITTQRAQELLPSGRLSVTHYRAIHRHLFQDVYVWAGNFRTVRIAKVGSMFCYPEHIQMEMRRVFGTLRNEQYFRDHDVGQFAIELASFLTELNAIHPFRDGNGRSQMVFTAILAQRAGHPLSLRRLRPEHFLLAMIAGFDGDEEPLTEEIRLLIG